MIRKMKRFIKRVLRKLKRILTGNNKRSNYKKLSPEAEQRIRNVMEKTGWNREKTLDTLRDAKKRTGMTFADYDRYDFHKIAVKDQKKEYARVLRRKERRADRKVAKLRKEFISQPINKITEAAQAPAAPDEALRYKTVIEYGGPRNGETDKQPKPIIAACYYLGVPLPENAVCAYQPSAYAAKTLSGELEDIRAALGDELLPDNKFYKRQYDLFRWKYNSISKLEHTSTDFAIYFTDWFLFCRDYGFSQDDYFDYDMYNKETEIRGTFLSNGFNGFRSHVKSVCNTNSLTFKDKGRFNAFFAPYVKRGWLDAENCTQQEFADFVSSRESFFAKPIRGTGGAGACILRTDSKPLPELYEYCKAQAFIIEDIVRQHPSLAQFNESTVNTVRLYTLLDIDGNAVITSALARFGRVGNCADNFHSGGVCALVDIESGIVSTNALGRAGIHYTEHPDSGLPILGYKIPEWEKLKATAKGAAQLCSEMNRHIGWDIAVTEDGDTEMIEGNCRPNFDAIQAIDKIGKRYIYEDLINELADAKGKKRYDFTLPEPDIDGMELPVRE